MLLRNPVARAISAINHIIRTGRISPLHNIDELLVGNKQQLVEGYGVIDKGRYYKQIQSYYEYFDPTQILVLFYEEDIVRNPTAGLSNVCEFLGIEPTFSSEKMNKRINTFNRPKLTLAIIYHLPVLSPLAQRLDRYFPTSKAHPNPDTLRQLYDFYEQDNLELFEWLNRRPDSWRFENQKQPAPST